MEQLQLFDDWPSHTGLGIMDEMVRPENLFLAYHRVKANGGAPGADGMTVEDLGPYLRLEWQNIQEQLLTGTYVPQPVRRVEIPKAGGGVRKLGVPTVDA